MTLIRIGIARQNTQVSLKLRPRSDLPLQPSLASFVKAAAIFGQPRHDRKPILTDSGPSPDCLHNTLLPRP